MTVMLAKNWWALELRGLAAIALGVTTLVWAGISRGEVVTLFGAYVLIDGLLNLAGVVRAAEANQRWGSLVFEAAAGIVAGILVLAWPAMSLFHLMGVIAAWALSTGMFEIASAVRLSSHAAHQSLLALSGVASLVLGILVVAIPLTTPFSVARWIGMYALLFGALLMVLGARLRNWALKQRRRSAIPAPTF